MCPQQKIIKSSNMFHVQLPFLLLHLKLLDCWTFWTAKELHKFIPVPTHAQVDIIIANA